jgi:hypothetical protein
MDLHPVGSDNRLIGPPTISTRGRVTIGKGWGEDLLYSFDTKTVAFINDMYKSLPNLTYLYSQIIINNS